MHLRVDITPPVARLLTAALHLLVFDLVWFSRTKTKVYHKVTLALNARETRGTFVVFSVCTYVLIAWALALPEQDGACQSGERWSAHLAAWGGFVGAVIWGTWNLIQSIMHGLDQWPVLRMLADTTWGILNCIASVCIVHGIEHEPGLWAIPAACALYLVLHWARQARQSSRTIPSSSPQ